MKLSNKETARQAIELLDLRHEPAVELYTKKSMAYMLNHPPFDMNSYKNIHAPKFFSAFDESPLLLCISDGLNKFLSTITCSFQFNPNFSKTIVTNISKLEEIPVEITKSSALLNCNIIHMART